MSVMPGHSGIAVTDNGLDYSERRVLEAGEVLLLHNWLLHSSDRNHSDRSRRAFSVCYMEADTYAGSPDETFPVVLPA